MNGIRRSKIMLNEKEKLFIIRKIDQWTPGKIGNWLNRSRSTVKSFIVKFNKTGSIKNLTSGGRPRTLTGNNLRRFLTHVKNNPKKTLKGFKLSMNINLSEKQIAVYLKRHGVNRYLQRKKPKIYEDAMKQRYDFARRHSRTSSVIWNRTIFCDESSIEEEKKYRKYCWRKKGLSLLSKHLDFTRKQYGKKYFKAFGFITINGPSELIIKENRWNKHEYIRMLESSNLTDIYRENMRLIQDNDRVHTSQLVQDWFREKKIRLLSIPPYSNDLNLMEPVWFELKRKLYPLNLHGAAMKNKAKEIFREISKDYIKKLYNSLPNRIDAIIAKKGYLTKYY